MENKCTNKIDMVLLWVDGNDPDWCKEKNKYLELEGDSRVNRYRDSGNLQYLFRGIEKYANWVNKIYFVTWGHLPKWLNTSNEKLVIVKHEDFIPKEYLPTFNSNVIELNVHRIKGLSNQFIILNDDFFFLKQTTAEDFFVDGKPTDTYVEYIQLSTGYNDVHFMMKANILALINKHFNKKECIEKNKCKFINEKYGEFFNSKTIFSMGFEKKFVGFWNFHAPYAYLKETFEKVWKEEEDNLKNACRNKFRAGSDLGHYLCRYWQLVTGDFEPKKDESKYLTYKDDNKENIEELKSGKYKYVCINDAFINVNFEKATKEINAVLEYLFPSKSSFEL